MIKKIGLNLYIWPLFVFVTMTALISVPFVRLFYSITTRDSQAVILRRMIHIYGNVLVRWIPFFSPVSVVNSKEAFPLPSPAIVVSNHCSSVDPYCFGVIPGDFSFLTSWPFRIPIYNRFMKRAQYIDSRNGWNSVRQQGLELLAQGCSLLIWPEGHRSRDGQIGTFQNGAFRLACESGHPIIPVYISGTGRLLPPGSRFLTPSRVSIKIFPPCYPEHISTDKQEAAMLSDRIREIFLAEKRLQENHHG